MPGLDAIGTASIGVQSNVFQEPNELDHVHTIEQVPYTYIAQVSPNELDHVHTIGPVTFTTVSQVLALDQAIDPSTEDVPEVGNLFQFGISGRESAEMIIKKIEPIQDLGARLHLVEHAPEIFDVDIKEIPDHDSQVTIPPEQQPPDIVQILSGDNVLERDTDGSLAAAMEVVMDVDPEPDGRDIQAQYKRSESTIWTEFDQKEITSKRFRISPVEVGVEYDVRVRAIRDIGLPTSWSVFENHEIAGKEGPPSDVENFRTFQSAELVVFQWDQIDDRDRDGYIIRRNTQGNEDWDSGEDVTDENRGTTITDASVPPGDHTFLIKAVDTAGNESVNANTYDMTVVENLILLRDQPQFSAWLGQGQETSEGLIKHPNGSLVPQDQKTADEYDAFEVFDQFVPTPVDNIIYESPEIDLGIDATVRTFSLIEDTKPPTSGAGTTVLERQFDSRTEEENYDGFEPLGLAELELRFVKHRVVINTDFAMPVLREFTPRISGRERVESDEIFVSNTGESVTFTQEFVNPPRVAVTPLSASSLNVTIENKDTKGFDIAVFDSNGDQTSGDVDWSATGV